jgi:hypothetical protein
MIRRILSALVVVFAAAAAALPAAAQSGATQGPAPAADDAPSSLAAADQTAIRHVIEAQLAAFQRDDGAEAFGYATPTIQQKFGDAQTFMAMVRGGYPAVYRPRSVAFDRLVDTEYGPDQILRVIGPDNASYTAHYLMQKQPDGSWMINGCYLTKGKDLGV